MALNKPTMMNPPVEGLLDKVDSKFTLVTLAAKRSRQINSYFNQLGEGLGAIVPPQVASVSRKPLSIALEEISVGKIRYIERVEGEGEGEEDGTDAAAADEVALAVVEDAVAADGDGEPAS